MRTRQNAVDAALLRVQRFLADYTAQLTGIVDLTAATPLSARRRGDVFRLPRQVSLQRTPSF